MQRFLLLTAMVAAAFVSPLQAQIPFIDKLIGSITDLNAFAVFGSLQGDLDGVTAGPVGSQDRDGLRGFGLEVSFGVGGFGTAPSSESPGPDDEACRRQVLSPELESPDTNVRNAELAKLRKACAGPDTAGMVYHPKTRETVTNGKGEKVTVTVLDSISVTDPKKENQPDALFNVEVALGFTQISSFRSQSVSPDFRGSLQEFPSIGTYITYAPAEFVSLYGGARVGLVKLDGLRAFELDTSITAGEPADSALRTRIYVGTGSTYLLGASGGLVLDAGPLSIFVERAYTRRRFGTVEWAQGSNEIIRTLPRSLKLDTWAWNIGAQATIKTN